MSYKPPNTGNSMHDFFLTLIDFNKIAPNILHATSIESFTRWLDKGIAIDKRSAYLYLKKHKKEIPVEYLKSAKARFAEEIEYDRYKQIQKNANGRSTDKTQ